MVILSSSGWGVGWWGLCGVFMVLCMGMMMLMMMRHGSHASSRFSWGGWGEPRERWPANAEQTLADRLARGEIDIDEYERRRRALRGSADADVRNG